MYGTAHVNMRRDSVFFGDDSFTSCTQDPHLLGPFPCSYARNVHVLGGMVRKSY